MILIFGGVGWSDNDYWFFFCFLEFWDVIELLSFLFCFEVEFDNWIDFG